MKAPTPRREVALRKQALINDLRAASRAAGATPDATLVSVRELSAKYGLALSTVSLEVQKLAEEGVLYTVPRVGTFVGRPFSGRRNLFLLVLPRLPRTPSFAALQGGFEERISRLGGTSMVLDQQTAQTYRPNGESTVLSGVFQWHHRSNEVVQQWNGVPRVEFGEPGTVETGADSVNFDNAEGGRQATRHLIALGHKKIAFVGLHGAEDEPGEFIWSRQRELGWEETMREYDLKTEGMSFLPPRTSLPDNQRETAHTALEPLFAREGITAIVVANAFVARGLFEGLYARSLPLAEWPAVVGFDSDHISEIDYALPAVTALRLPWESLGREAANLLWERSQGHLTGGPVQRLVPMSLIPRLSCRRDWFRMPSLVEYPAAGTFVLA
jgi:DNA-binding LacI/PurR family transcriptional regulator